MTELSWRFIKSQMAKFSRRELYCKYFSTRQRKKKEKKKKKDPLKTNSRAFQVKIVRIMFFDQRDVKHRELFHSQLPARFQTWHPSNFSTKNSTRVVQASKKKKNKI
mgnify:CR=1 FL=1